MIITALELPFADGEYLFNLDLPQLAELQEKRGGVFAIYGRLLKGRHMLTGVTIEQARELFPMTCEFTDMGDGTILAVDFLQAEAHSSDVFEVIRLGLIGGRRGLVEGREVEVSALTAKSLVERYCHPAPLKESWAIAAAVVGARIKGYAPKKAEPAERPAKPKATKSTSKRSSATA